MEKKETNGERELLGRRLLFRVVWSVRYRIDEMTMTMTMTMTRTINRDRERPTSPAVSTSTSLSTISNNNKKTTHTHTHRKKKPQTRPFVPSCYEKKTQCVRQTKSKKHSALVLLLLFVSWILFVVRTGFFFLVSSLLFSSFPTRQLPYDRQETRTEEGIGDRGGP